MSDLELLLHTRKEYQEKLNTIFSKYFLYYMKNIYSEDCSLRNFQKHLFKIPNWSDEKISKEFTYFIKYTIKKYNITENDLTKILDMIFGLYIKTLTSIFDQIEVKVPAFKIFWFKCFKRIAKFLYETPLLIKNTEDNKISSGINEAIKYIIFKFIPFKDIINTTPKIIEEYNFEDGKYSSSGKNHKKKNSVKEDTVKEHTDKDKKASIENELKYIGSDEFENEYYHSNSEKDKNDVNNEKQIKIQTKKKWINYKK